MQAVEAHAVTGLERTTVRMAGNIDITRRAQLPRLGLVTVLGLAGFGVTSFSLTISPFAFLATPSSTATTLLLSHSGCVATPGAANHASGCSVHCRSRILLVGTITGLDGIRSRAHTLAALASATTVAIAGTR